MRRGFATTSVLALLVGCVTRPLAVSRGEVFAHVGELRERGEARVELEAGGTTTLRMDQEVRVETDTHRLWGLIEGTDVARTTVAGLVESCPDVAPFREDRFRRDPPCRLQDIDRVIAGSRRVTDWHRVREITAVALGSTGLFTLAGTAYCVVACEEDLGWETGLSLVGLGAGLAALSILIVPKD